MVALSPGVLNINTFLGLFFTRFLFPEGGDGGQAGGDIRVYIEFIAAAYRPPTKNLG